MSNTSHEIRKSNTNPWFLQLIGLGAKYFVKTPRWLMKFFPNRLWKVDTKEKVIYLTFDDGPHPETTSFVLDKLKQHHAAATFFCIGKNVAAHPQVYKRILNEGHRVGNHSYSHQNGWKTENTIYLSDITEAAKLIDSSLFRPPYGKIRFSQAKKINEAMGRMDTTIVMWDVLSGDFDTSISPEKCRANVERHSGPGSIVVFHDSVTAFPVLQKVLPDILSFFAERGYAFRSL